MILEAANDTSSKGMWTPEFKIPTGQDRPPRTHSLPPDLPEKVQATNEYFRKVISFTSGPFHRKSNFLGRKQDCLYHLELQRQKDFKPVSSKQTAGAAWSSGTQDRVQVQQTGVL